MTATSAEYAAFLFTDVVGSTSLVYAIGDDAWRHLRGWHDRTMRTVFAVHGGEEIDNAGDGFFVAFAVPDAAISCAVDIQRTLARHRVEHGFAPQVRIGVHAGRAARLDARFTGQAVVTAARIGSTAGGGEILVSRSTVAETPGVAWFEPRLVQLTGIVDPVEVVSVSWD
ncbi:MAG TPA: adenylate/guanylate cyclase domain-containing protein [Gaiellaceae bacterium]|nr:adenylate/guanylate cyclase domain-containing protein [Gaiellaceae bacterium]